MNRLDFLKAHIVSQPSYSKIQVSKIDEIGTITLNSPKDLNSLSLMMREEICKALVSHNNDPQIKVIVIFSSHAKVFCAGANIKEFLQKDYEHYLKHQIFLSLENTFRNISVPIIAAVDGVALGGGCELALLCDHIICSQKASFGFPQITLGLIPGIGGTQRATKILGEKLTMKMVLTGQPITGAKAAERGFAQLVISAGFKQNTLKIAQKMASKSISALIAGKKAVKYASNSLLSQGLQFQRSVFYPLLATKGAKQGVTAFIEKRKPNFKGI